MEIRSIDMFEGFDFTDFWKESKYASEHYVSAPPTDALIAEIEQELRFKLPASYIRLMKQHNGGKPAKTACPCAEPTSWADDHVSVRAIMGIGREKPYSLCGEMGSAFWTEEWEYPEIGVAIATTPSGGHNMIYLDYRACGKDGEPAVVWVDAEADYRITPLAPDFETFIRSLRDEHDYET